MSDWRDEEVVVELDDEAESGPMSAAYTLGVSVKDNEMRIVYFDDLGAPLGHQILEAHEAYDFAQRILRAYDELEGL